MRKQFETRVRLVIYMDARDLNRLTARAKREGRVLVAWARDVLLGASVKDAVQSHSVQGEPATSLASVNKKDSIPETGTQHTAQSNRLTCMCATCSAYRHDHNIPLGGLPKKAKGELPSKR
jgi:hypothetical protein